MNKYQEALETMCKRCINHEMCQGTGCQPKKDLQELVERATPKKPIDRTKYEDRSNGFFEYHGETLRDIRCPNCNKRIRLVHKYKHCAKCGQRLLWEK